MRAYVRLDDGVCQDLFEIEQGPRQKCVLSWRLVSIFFAAVLIVVFRRHSEDTVIFVELFHLKESPMSLGREPATNYARHAVWGMMYADDAYIVSPSPRGRAKMVEVIVEVK